MSCHGMAIYAPESSDCFSIFYAAIQRNGNFIYSTRGSAKNVKLLSGWQSARATCFRFTTFFPGCARHKAGRKVVFNSFKSSAQSFFKLNFPRAIFTRGSLQTQANHRQTARRDGKARIRSLSKHIKIMFSKFWAWHQRLPWVERFPPRAKNR